MLIKSLGQKPKNKKYRMEMTNEMMADTNFKLKTKIEMLEKELLLKNARYSCIHNTIFSLSVKNKI